MFGKPLFPPDIIAVAPEGDLPLPAPSCLDWFREAFVDHDTPFQNCVVARQEEPSYPAKYNAASCTPD